MFHKEQIFLNKYVIKQFLKDNVKENKTKSQILLILIKLRIINRL